MVCKPCPATGPLGQIPVVSADGDCQQSRTVAGGYMHKIQNVAGQSAHRLTDLLMRSGGTVETGRDTGDAHQGLRLVSETRRNAGDVGDGGRMAHNPEVEGSNPSPATKARGPFSNREGAFCMRFANGYVNLAPAQTVRTRRPAALAPWDYR